MWDNITVRVFTFYRIGRWRKLTFPPLSVCGTAGDLLVVLRLSALFWLRVCLLCGNFFLL